MAAAADRQVADCEPVCLELPGQCQAVADRLVADHELVLPVLQGREAVHQAWRPLPLLAIAELFLPS